VLARACWRLCLTPRPSPSYSLHRGSFQIARKLFDIPQAQLGLTVEQFLSMQGFAERKIIFTYTLIKAAMKKHGDLRKEAGAGKAKKPSAGAGKKFKKAEIQMGQQQQQQQQQQQVRVHAVHHVRSVLTNLSLRPLPRRVHI
jgi:hypothetical protein